MGIITFKKQTEPTTPTSDYSKVYLDTADGFLKMKNPDGSITIFSNSIGITKVADTGTEINLGNFFGTVCNMGSANATTTYTLTGSVDFGNAVVLINSASEPSVTGATKILGSDFIADTDMYLQVFNNGTRVEYWLEQIAA